MYHFFFQAEDGIRATSVTGVQTCALPIYIVGTSMGAVIGAALAAGTTPAQVVQVAESLSPKDVASLDVLALVRSEERRVGKECGGGWGRRQWAERMVVVSARGEMTLLRGI